MATHRSFEETEVWQRARALSYKIYCLSRNGSFALDFKLRDQINGASGSIMDNIAEGFERDGSREFRQFLAVAKGSAGEVRSQLNRALDRQHISNEDFANLNQETITIGKQLAGLMNYLTRTKFKGIKYNQQKSEIPK